MKVDVSTLVLLWKHRGFSRHPRAVQDPAATGGSYASGMRTAISDLGFCSAAYRHRQPTHVAVAYTVSLQPLLPRANLQCFPLLRNVVSRLEVYFVWCLPLEGRVWRVLVVLIHRECRTLHQMGHRVQSLEIQALILEESPPSSGVAIEIHGQ